MTREQLAAQIKSISYLQGQFKLRSGQSSTEYFDKYRFESQPHLLKAIAKHLAPLIPPATEVLAGLELGGIPIATALSLETGLPQVFVRKEAKSYGTCQFAEGLNILNKRICIVEDVITTGGQVVLSAQDLRNLGAIVQNVICVIHRGSTPEPKLDAVNLNLRALFTKQELSSGT